MARAPEQKEGEQDKPLEEEEERDEGNSGPGAVNPLPVEEEKLVTVPSQASSPAKGRRTTLEVTPQQD